MMGISGKTVRSILAPCMMLAGALGGWWVAKNYLEFLATPGNVESGFMKNVTDFLSLGGPPDLLTKSILFATLIVIGLLVGLVLSLVVYRQMVRAKQALENSSPQEKIAVASGLTLGLGLTVLIVFSLPMAPWARVLVALVLSYLGVVATMSMKEQLRWYFPGIAGETAAAKAHLQRPKILDTNVIIDGRIADICRVGFVESPIYIPRFVLEELQQIADSTDSLKRARGRRGLDILNQMQKEMDLQITEYDTEGQPEEVDAKLVALAQELNGSIVTNDFNLNKVAELQGVKVLNVNELANALKPVVLPGEEMSVTIIKEGKEQNQGIGYLDDGTMVVVEGARRFINETLHVVVTSVLQTVAGKMIFATMKEDHEEEEELIDRNIRSYSSGRQRKKIR
ncbi:MAG: PIN domain-containing protein [Armatimonadota bacterium]|nr:PIN domain-containing protein [Armatimonadota bacterium]